jgi:dTDP-4-amino-4,6-dideoxygalactose transaminase
MNKFLANSLFGMGAAALVLTNKPSLARKAKYQLLHSVRAHVGQDDRYSVLRFAYGVLVCSYAAVHATILLAAK